MLVDNKEIVVNGRFLRTARLKAEYYEFDYDPYEIISKVKASKLSADLFTFMQGANDRSPRYDFHFEWDSIAAIPISTFDHWWKKQINDKTRNMIRKAQKSGVETRVIEFSDELVMAIGKIYDESPVRQGKPFAHCGKNFDELKREHITFLDRSEFIGAFYGNEVIGFVKLVHGDGVSSLMHIISMLTHRDKAPTNALIAKAVEICALRGVPYIHYGVWSRRGLGDFKRHHAFERLDLPRYFVPLNLWGNLGLKFGLHKTIKEHFPENWVDFLVDIRSRWYKQRVKQN